MIKENNINLSMKYINFEEDWEEDFPKENDYQTIKDINKDFYDFLIDKGIIDIYIDNFTTENIRINFSIFNIEDFLKNVKPVNYISNAFSWSFTKQGGYFWNNIGVDWDNYLYDKRK